MKLLHSADWHINAPIQGRSPEQAERLRRSLAAVAHQIVALANKEHCDLMLLSGDLFDGPPSADCLSQVQQALAEAHMRVFIAPGNHDPMGVNCGWDQPGWPENVHIFRSSAIQSVSLPQLDCRVWGAAFQGCDCPALLNGFRAEGSERYAIGLFHGDPTQASSPYNPISRLQVQESGLDYLALGHIHKGDSFQAGDTLCAWPGCPMGRGFDELGEKGVLIVTLEGTVNARFVPLSVPRFHWLKVPVGSSASDALAAALPGAASEDFFRVELTGEWEDPDIPALLAHFPQFPNLELRDCTQPPIDLWANTDQDSLEGVFFSLLQQSDAPADIKEAAARICRRLLQGQEVVL